MSLNSSSLTAAIAVTRFGLGAQPGEMGLASADPRAFLKAQIRPQGADQPTGPLKSSTDMLGAYGEYQQGQRQVRDSQGAQAEALAATQKQVYRDLRTSSEWAEILARDQLAASTPASFRERWTRFWSNHFTVAGTRQATIFLSGPFEREAIRPHVFGRFEDMLQASTRHPAMLTYLDQTRSTGPNSQAAAGRPNTGLNENLAREVMELHTVGVAAGYTQQDVTEFARALTGWSIDIGRKGPPQPFVFRAAAHEPGSRTVLGRTYAAAGEGQAAAILHDLATHPQTARHVGLKLARHFVADDPPPALTDRLAQALASSGGRLDQVATVLVDSPEAWQAGQRKFKTPNEFLLSSWRALGHVPADPQECIRPMQSLGQRPLIAPSPKGWPEEAANWAAPGDLVKRISLSETLAGKAGPDREPAQVAADALGPLLTGPVVTAMARAESRPEALAIMLMSPEFQRR